MNNLVKFYVSNGGKISRNNRERFAEVVSEEIAADVAATGEDLHYRWYFSDDAEANDFISHIDNICLNDERLFMGGIVTDEAIAFHLFEEVDVIEETCEYCDGEACDECNGNGVITSYSCYTEVFPLEREECEYCENGLTYDLNTFELSVECDECGGDGWIWN